ncbi:MAG TPA: HAMP domain-containing sensor histidine kinase [Gemmatimonadales bacterium]|nr:HAMP domain-containing sensor histidine kinase [Gemmatimonadales bacterium]
MPGSAYRRITRAGPEIVLALVLLLSGVSLWQAWRIADHLRRDARDTSRIYGQVIAGLQDPTPGAETQALLHLVAEIRATGLPVVVTDSNGTVLAAQNLPFPATASDPRVATFAQELDRTNPPIRVAARWEVHFGQLPVNDRLNDLAILQIVLLGTVLAVAFWAYRIAVHRDRDRVWVAMARESAHQLGTPLMSAHAWIDRLADGEAPATAAKHLRADMDRLQRVAQRFERIGRPARRERVALGALVERVAQYFRPRLPRHAHQVSIVVDAPESGPIVEGDAVLLEWAIEALIGNAIDALSGRDGTITVAVTADGTGATVRVRDDGPGVDPAIRARVFEPGVTTKRGGWGIGLALSQRIVEDVHGGRLTLGAPPVGAELIMHLPLGAT